MLTPAFRVAALLTGLLAFAPLASAQDTIVGIFSDPVLTGNIIAVDGSLSPYNNTTSAFVEITSATDLATNGQQLTGSKLQWGNDPGFSTLIFFGKTVPGDPYQNFDLGTLAYGNGTSALSSLIFGGKLTLYATPNGTLSSNEANGPTQIDIVTTANLGLAGDEQHDADFVTLSGVANHSFNVLEGAYATAELYGHFVNDPTIVVTSIVLNPGQGGAGFIGNGAVAAVPVPESSNLLAGLAVLGLIGYEVFGRQRRLA